MKLKGRVVNKGNIEGEAIVLEKPFLLLVTLIPVVAP